MEASEDPHEERASGPHGSEKTSASLQQLAVLRPGGGLFEHE